jgi:mannose-1-phosphate guanylyltransferase
MIETVFTTLAQHGITDVVLSLGYLPDRFIEAYPDGEVAGVRISYAIEPELLDTAGAIRFAATVGDFDSTFLVMNGDVLTNLDITKLVAFHREHDAEATIALHEVDDPSRFGVVPTTPTNFINAGTYIFEPSVLDRIAPSGRVSVERVTFPALAADETLFAMPDNDAYWLDTGTPEAFLRANVDLMTGRIGGHHATGVVDGSWQQASAAVDASARLVNSVVDRHCVVEADVVLDQSVLLPGAVVERGAVVRSSIVGPRAVIGSFSTLDATCVVGANVHVASRSAFSGDVRLEA